MSDAPTTPTTLEWYVEAIADDVAFAAESKAIADELVNNLIGEGNPFAVPEAVVGRAQLEVGADLYYRKSSRNGIVGLDGVDPQPMRLNRDPLAAAYPFLRPYLVFGL